MIILFFYNLGIVFFNIGQKFIGNNRIVLT